MKIHHYGIIVRDIKLHFEKYFLPFFNENQLTSVIYDKHQDVSVAFIEAPGGYLELVEPGSPESPVSALLKKHKAMYHHVCLEVSDIESALEKCRDSGMWIVSTPKPAAAFAGRHIAFVMGANGLLWELLQARK